MVDPGSKASTSKIQGQEVLDDLSKLEIRSIYYYAVQYRILRSDLPSIMHACMTSLLLTPALLFPALLKMIYALAHYPVLPN